MVCCRSDAQSKIREPCIALLRSHHSLPVSGRVQYKLPVFCVNIFEGSCPACFSEFFFHCILTKDLKLPHAINVHYKHIFSVNTTSKKSPTNISSSFFPVLSRDKYLLPKSICWFLVVVIVCSLSFTCPYGCSTFCSFVYYTCVCIMR